MGNPLQDQLLKAGLINKKQAKKAKHEQYLSRKKKEPAKNDCSNKAAEERTALAQRNRELNKRRAQEKEQHEQQAQIKQLIENNRLKPDKKGEPYHFVVQNKIHRMFVAEEVIDQLCDGHLAVVKYNECFEVVPAKVAHQIVDRDKEAVAVFREHQ